MSNNLRCDGCGMPSEVASQFGMQFELQKDGRVLCSVCSKIMPILNEDMKNNITRKSKDFAAYISTSACMFDLDPISVMFSSGEIFIESIGQIALSNKKLAISSIEKYIEDLKIFADKIKNKVNEEQEVKHE